MLIPWRCESRKAADKPKDRAGLAESNAPIGGIGTSVVARNTRLSLSVHPSSILRAQDADREREFAALVDDLTVVASALGRS